MRYHERCAKVKRTQNQSNECSASHESHTKLPLLWRPSVQALQPYFASTLGPYKIHSHFSSQNLGLHLYKRMRMSLCNGSKLRRIHVFQKKWTLFKWISLMKGTKNHERGRAWQKFAFSNGKPTRSNWLFLPIDEAEGDVWWMVDMGSVGNFRSSLQL